MCSETKGIAPRLGGRGPLAMVPASPGLLEISVGDSQAARRVCELPTAAIEYMGIREPIFAIFLPEALETLISIGQLERAQALLDRFEERADGADRGWARATAERSRGLILAAKGDLASAAAALDRSLAEHERFDMPLYKASTLLARGALHRRARRRAEAKRCFEEALAIFLTAGATLWAERARQERDRLGLRRSPGAELTDNERRVAELAAEGKTNREIARTLFVSPKTVEAILGHIYRKLGIRSRAELGVQMASRLPQLTKEFVA